MRVEPCCRWWAREMECTADVLAVHFHLCWVAAGAVTIGKAIYVVGGRTRVAGGQFTEHALLDVFENGAWRSLPSMPTARSGLGAGTLGGKLYAIGGEFPGGVFREVEAFDPARGTWRKVAPLPSGRHGIGVGAVGNRLYVMGGFGQGAMQGGANSSFGM